MEHKVLIHDADTNQWLAFSRPRLILNCSALDDVLPALEKIEEQVKTHRCWAAGWLSYEAAKAFDNAFVTHASSEFPLLWFGLFEKCEPLDLASIVSAEHVSRFRNSLWSLNCNPSTYAKKIKQIKQQIRDGNTYQVNYTIRQFADMDVSPQDAFFAFAANARYGAFIDAGRYALCCASPELFFEIKNGVIYSRPMKGTAARGRYLSEDMQRRDELYNSKKNRAENLMIVDMIRNDISRIAQTGSVKVPALFEIEKYPTVWQMTSTVTASVSASLKEIFQALYPCASITGAPKANTMKIIADLETSARNIYTGSIGFIRPDMSMQFNVAIRTVLIDQQFSQAEYGVGGGIIWDSTGEDEYEECLIKSKVLSGKGTYIHQLLETLLWNPQSGYFLLEYHLNRLADSAQYFDYVYNKQAVLKALNKTVTGLTAPHRVRLLLASRGQITLSAIPMHEIPLKQPYSVALADTAVDSNDIYLYHKTTQRDIYDYFKAKYSSYDDVLLVNHRGELTESCIANIVLDIDGEKLTPPIDAGLLNGTYRQYLIDKKEIKEKALTPDDLNQAQAVYLINSVRGIWPIEWVSQPV